MEQSNKLLLNFQGVPMISAVVKIALGAKCTPVVVVTGTADSEIAKAIANLPVEIASNPDQLGGMARSLSVGISKLPQDVEGCIIMLGDMPLITTQTVMALRSRFEFERGDKIIYPVHGNDQGNPVIFPRKCFDALSNLSGDRGGKELFEQNRFESVPVEINSAEIFMDVDTQSDYEGLMAKMNTSIND